MENVFIPAIPKTCWNYQIPVKLENSLEGHPNPGSTLSFIKKKDPVISDDHLNYLCRNGRLLEAVRALDSISRHGSLVKPCTYINLLQSCIDTGSIHLGRIIHARINLVAEDDPFVGTKLVSMYAKCGCLSEARKVFDSMRERNLYTWSAIIGAYSRERRWREVMEFFRLMLEDGVLPDDFLLPKILEACGNCRDVETGRLIHSFVTKHGMGSCPRVSNSILAVYAKCEELTLATRFFRNMIERDVVAWNSLLLAYCKKSRHEEALQLVEEMEKEGIVPGLVTWNILICGYNQRGQCDAALDLMKKMKSVGVTADVFTWTAMISSLTQNGRRIHALDMFREMFLMGILPNGITIMSAVSTCSCLKVLNLGLEVHSVAVRMGLFDDILVGNSLIDMYSKCGNLEAARKVFDSLKNKDVYTWNSMITAYCQAGFCGKAYELLMRMQESNEKPNVITWNTIISGYIKNGDEDEAVDLFQRMESYGKVKRSTASWNLIIAGYKQNGKGEEALQIFQKMQSSGVTPNSVTILSVLPACANLLATKKVREIHGCVLRRNLDSVHAVKNALIDTYAKSGNIEYPAAIFKGMDTKDIITWNSLIGGYVLHGSYALALDLFDQMKRLGLKPNRGTLGSIILAHSLAGNVHEGKQVFSSMAEDYRIMPALEHYSAMICLYGRSGRLKEALQFIYEMNLQSEPSIWAALLTACRTHGDVDLAFCAAEHLSEESRNPATQHLVSKLYALGGKNASPQKVRKSGKEKLSRKTIGQSWIESRNFIYAFSTGDQSRLCTDVLYHWVERICRKDDRSDYHGELVIEEEETEEICGVHSEKLAIAFGLVSSSLAPRTIRILKNVRMCRDCHRTAKYISKTYGCVIYLNDTKCLHIFKNGDCSCRDYW